MECNIFAVNNGYLSLIDIVPYNSMVYELKYLDSGIMQAVFPNEEPYVSDITVGRFVSINVKPTGSLMYIHTVKRTDNEIWAYGYEAKELLNKTAMLGTSYTPPTTATSIATLIDSAVTALYTYSWGKVDATYISSAITESVNPTGLEYLSLCDYLRELCRPIDAGMILRYDETYRKGALAFYKGTDKTASVIFATNFGNIRGSEYTDSDKSYVNTVIALGSDNVVVTDAESNISETYAAVLDWRELYPRDTGQSVANYTAALQTRAHMSRIARSRRKDIDLGDINAQGYGTDYTLGDVVGVFNPTTQTVERWRVTAARFEIEGNSVATKLTLSAE